VTGVAVVTAMVLLLAAEQFTVVHACGEVGEHCTVHRVGYPALAALFVHSLADGLAIAFSFRSSEPLGTAVGVAVIAHKCSDGMTLSTLFLDSGHSRAKTAGLVGVLALATPLGVLMGMSTGPVGQRNGVGGSVGVGGGGIYLYQHGGHFAAHSQKPGFVVLGFDRGGRGRERVVTAPMTITVNGENKTVETGLSLAQLVAQMGLTTGRLASEVNGDVVRRADYAARILVEGDRIEIVQMIGGG
jgi:sulfur carrier protein